MSKVNLLNEHALIKFVGCGNNDKSNRFLHLYDPVTENPIYIWSIDKIKEFARTDIGVRMTLCERCYRSHSLPHHHTFIVPAFFLDKCLSFFCRETRASIVFVGQGNDRTGSTVYQITSHDCGSRILPPASPAPPTPTSSTTSVSPPISVEKSPLPSERPPLPLPSVPSVPPVPPVPPVSPVPHEPAVPPVPPVPSVPSVPKVPPVPNLSSQPHTVWVHSAGDFGTLDQQHSSLKTTPKVSRSLPPRDLPRWDYLGGPPAYIPPDPLEPYSVSKRIHIDDKGRTLKLPNTPRGSMRAPHQGSFVNVVLPRQTAFDSNLPRFHEQIVSDHPSSHPSHPFNHLASNSPTARHTPHSLLDPSALQSGLTTASAIHNAETLLSSSSPSTRRLPTVHGETHPYVNVPILTPTQPPPLPPRIRMPAQMLANRVSKSPSPIPKEVSLKPFTQARRNQTMREIRSNKRPQEVYCCDSDTDVGVVSSYDTHNEAPDLYHDSVCTDNLKVELNDTRKMRSRTVDGIVDYVPNSDSTHSINPHDTTDTPGSIESVVSTSTAVTIDSDVSPFPAVADSTFLQQPDSSTYAMGSPDVYSKTNGHFNTDPKFAMSGTSEVTTSANGNIRYNIVDNPQYRNYFPTSSDKKTDCFDERQSEHDGNLLEVRNGDDWDHSPELYINTISRNTVAVDREIPTFGNHGDEHDPNTGEVLERNVTSFTNNTGDFSALTVPKQFSQNVDTSSASQPHTPDQSQLSGFKESSSVSSDPPPIPSKASKSLSREHTIASDGDGTHLQEKNQPRRLPPPPATKPKPPLKLSQQSKISNKK